MAIALTFAANVWFPVPFTVITLVPSFYVVSITCICMVAGISVVQTVLKDTKRLFRYGCFIATQQLMALIYPAYQVLFLTANNTKYQLPVILLLPVIKLIVKNIALRCVTHMEDMMPEAVIFTVDFFNALYMSTTMESATSTWTVVIVVVIDVAQSATVLLRLHRTTATLLRRLNQTIKPYDSNKSMLSASAQLCRSADSFGRQYRQRIRIRSCLLHDITGEERELLDRLERTPFQRVHRRSSVPTKCEKNVVFTARRNLSKVATWTDRTNPSSTFSGDSGKWKISSHSAIAHPRILLEALEVLFSVECLLLSAFLDTFVPFFYGIFMFVMVHLQSSKYHFELVGVTTDTIGDVVDSIFLFSFVGLVAFGLLATLIYRNLGMNALYHLAFVLETQMELIQSKLFAWVTMTLAFRVVHFGRYTNSFLLIKLS
ncbi:unnamed protein product [Phytophthora fragariaefolia]|uniref:Unnamed protein product n=1 Tax=Phytophthora fragariaefolia TaxID=1490495 RepID=A0A9W7CRC6_9STRA|nr:unnamed protein product [Phytophthora fragariaefolia]